MRGLGAPLWASPVSQAETLFNSGVSRYEVSDYPGAIDRFSEAYEVSKGIADAQQQAEVLHALQFNLARAHVKSYGIDQDIRHLRIAIDLLNKYIANDAGLETDDEAESLMAVAQSELETHESSHRGAHVSSGTVDEQHERSMSSETAKGLRVGGYVSLGLAGATLGLLGGGMAMVRTS